MARAERKLLEKAQEAVEALEMRYPNLTIRRETAASASDIDWTIPVQPGIRYEILIYVSGDELYFDVGGFHSSYFPCDKEEPRARFIDAVTGFIDGRYCVREHYRRGICIAAVLGSPNQGSFRGVASWSRLHWPFPRRKEYRILRNVD